MGGIGLFALMPAMALTRAAEGIAWECPPYYGAAVVGVMVGLGIAVVVLVIAGSPRR